MKRINIYLTDAEDAMLRQLVQETGILYAELVRRAVDRYLSEPDVVKHPQHVKDHADAPC